MSLQELVSNYGYLAISIGTFLEGETILILGGLAAHRGFLQLPLGHCLRILGRFLGKSTVFPYWSPQWREFLGETSSLASKVREGIFYGRQTPNLADLGFQFYLRRFEP